MAGRTVWFPGHMAKGRRELEGLAEKLDLFVEVRDARAPRATASPGGVELAALRPVWVVLAKRDLAGGAGTERWMTALRAQGRRAWAFDLLRDGVDDLRSALIAASPRHREVRLAVVGIPNVGKSQLLNLLIGKHSAAVGGIPGVTRGVAWYRSREGLLVVDSPGILDPHGGAQVHRMLAWLGCSKGDVTGGYELLGTELLRYLREQRLWELVEKTWGIPESVPEESASLDEEDSGDVGTPEETNPRDDLHRVGRRLGCLVRGGRVNREAAGKKLCEAFATGKLGRVTLERAPEVR